MRRTWLVPACAFSAAVLAIAAAPAFGAVIELGQTKSPVIAPPCPATGSCNIVLEQVTALQTVRDGVAYPTTVKKAGYVVAFTIGLSGISANRATQKADIHTLDTDYGGTTRAGLVVLQPIGRHRLFKWKLVAESPIFHLQPYLGQVVQFPLLTPLPVRPGDTLGLTVPTWAPVLSINLSASTFAYRQSRDSACSSPPTVASTQSIGEILAYKCDYPGTRVEYSATEITSPVPDKRVPGT